MILHGGGIAAAIWMVDHAKFTISGLDFRDRGEIDKITHINPLSARLVVSLAATTT